ncbi:MAG: histidine kinase, partial [Gemmatimonadetes bacterium]|nr:histidine kinase [Gemmatimonadota bacterium]
MHPPTATPDPPGSTIPRGVALAVYAALSLWLAAERHGRWSLALPTAAVLGVAGWAVLARVRRAPVGRTRWAARGAWFAAVVVAAPALALGTRRLVAAPRSGEGWAFAAEAAVVAAFAGAAHALEYARRQREQEMASLRLEAEVARLELERRDAELRALRAQLDPGFLLDTLGAAARLLRATPAAAETLVVRLADLLRRAMSGASPGGALWEEMEGADRVLEVERLRLGGLRVDWAVEDDALDAAIPPGVLQPLAGSVLRGRSTA